MTEEQKNEAFIQELEGMPKNELISGLESILAKMEKENPNLKKK